MRSGVLRPDVPGADFTNPIIIDALPFQDDGLLSVRNAVLQPQQHDTNCCVTQHSAVETAAEPAEQVHQSADGPLRSGYVLPVDHRRGEIGRLPCLGSSCTCLRGCCLRKAAQCCSTATRCSATEVATTLIDSCLVIDCAVPVCRPSA